MKKVALLFLLLTAFLSTALAACGFVEYLPEKEENSALAAKKREYVGAIYAVSSEREFRGEYLRSYELLLLDAENELLECESEEELQPVFDRHAAKITALASESLAFERQTALQALETYLCEEDYRSGEWEEIIALREEAKANVRSAGSVTETDEIYRAYVAAVYPFKTDRQYYAEELAALKESRAAELSAWDPAAYREAERGEIAALVAAFAAALPNLSTKEAVEALAADYRGQIAAVPTDATLFQAEKAALTGEKIAELSAFAAELPFSPEEAAAYRGELSALEEEMLACASQNALLVLFQGAKFDLYERGARLGHEPSRLGFCAELAARGEAAFAPSSYREEQRTALLNALAAFSTESSAETDVDRICALYDGYLAAAAALPTNDELWAAEDEAVIGEIGARYGANHLPLPEPFTQANDYFELANIIDFYAYYQLSNDAFLRDTFRVELTFPHKDAQWEVNEVYWYCELVRSAVGITAYFEEGSDYLVVRLIPYALASESNAHRTEKRQGMESAVEYPLSVGTSARGAEFEDFGYLQYEKTLTGVWNTQQLWYALEHEYIPLCVEGSPAEATLLRAKEILREVVKEGMTTEEKIFHIFTWFAKNVQYDYRYNEYLTSSDRDRFPDERAATLKAFHAEGALFEGLAVCCGYAKSYLVLLRLEGIESQRIFIRNRLFSGHNAINYQQVFDGDGFGSHAFVAIKLSDGKYYYSDTEQSFYNQTVNRYHQMLVPPSVFTGYNGYSYLYGEMEFGTEIPEIYRNLTYGGKGLYPTDGEDLAALLDAFYLEGEGKQLSVFSDGGYAGLKEDLVADGRFSVVTLKKANAAPDFTEFILYREEE